MLVLPKARGLLFIVSGPAGSGKTTLCNRLLGAFSPHLDRVVTATTRASRKGERQGLDYHFLTDAEFDENIREKAFYEYALVHGQRYGVLKSEVMPRLESGLDLTLNVDVQGAAALRKAAEEDDLLRESLITLFLMPSDLKVIQRRLEGRGADDTREIERRLTAAEEEIKRWREYDYCLVSGEKDMDFAKAKAIYEAEKLRVARLSTAS